MTVRDSFVHDHRSSRPAGRPGAARTAGFRTQPHNIEAEQALLGAILINNEAYHRVSDFLRPEHFYEPVHAPHLRGLTRLIEQGRLADHVTLKVAFDEDEALRELDGAQYLARLARAAETIINAGDYGRLLHDLGAQARADPASARRSSTRPTIPRCRKAVASRSRPPSSELFKLAQEGEFEGGFRDFPAVLTSAVDDGRVGLPQGQPGHRACRPG